MKQRRFAAFDLDGTLIRWQLYHSLADAFLARGYIDGRQLARAHAARLSWQQRASHISFHDYEQELIKAFDRIVKQLSHEQFEQAAADVFAEYKDRVYIFTRDLLRRLQRQGYVLLAISGSPSEVVTLVAKYYGFTDFLASTYHRRDSGFNGAKTVVAWDKAAALKKLVRKHDLSFKGSLAVGDTKSDVAMLELVESPIAFNPERQLLTLAKRRGWPVVVERKNVIYSLTPDSDGRYRLA